MAARDYDLEIAEIDATLVSIEKVLNLPKLRDDARRLEEAAGTISISGLLSSGLTIDSSAPLLTALRKRDRKSTRLNSSHVLRSRMPSSA